MERKFELKPEFKAMALEALSKLSFSQVHQVARLVKDERTVYTETEANAVVGFLGEMAYRDVAHIFDAMPQLVVEIHEEGVSSPTEAPMETAAN